VEHDCVAIVVDALRASATAAMLFHEGALEILVAREVEAARQARRAWPGALLYGERDGLPPEGFDHGNSPQEASHAAGKRVIFTTTTGANRLVHCWGARAAYMGSPVNARAVVAAAVTHGCDVVVIPAGLTGHPHFDAQEDWAGAAFLAQCANAVVGEGRARCDYWQARIASEGLTTLFESAPHATHLRHLGFESDIPFCAQVDLTGAVPMAVDRNAHGVLLRNANA
jgi:2-phosphosulfolactate phosphatase